MVRTIFHLHVISAKLKSFNDSELYPSVFRPVITKLGEFSLHIKKSSVPILGNLYKLPGIDFLGVESIKIEFESIGFPEDMEFEETFHVILEDYQVPSGFDDIKSDLLENGWKIEKGE